MPVPRAMPWSRPCGEHRGGDECETSHVVVARAWPALCSPLPEREMKAAGCRHLDIILITHHDVPMRTTLTLDDDVAAALREQARLRDRPFKQVVNDALRRGMSLAVEEGRPAYRVRPNQSGFKPGVDPLRLNQLNDELEAGAFARRSAG